MKNNNLELQPTPEQTEDMKEALESLRSLDAERVQEDEKRAELEARTQESETRDLKSAEALRDKIKASEPESVLEPGLHRTDLYGAFESEDRQNGKIILEGEVAKALAVASETFRKEAKAFSNLAVGERIAADYDTKTNNFRSQTDLVQLPDGRNVYLLYDYPGTWLHRSMDGLMKKMNGIPMRKVGRGEMKTRHAEMSPIPQIKNSDPHMVAMPAIPNANAKDVFAHNMTVDRVEGESDEAFSERTISDFKACDEWANSAGLSEKLEMAGKVMEEMRRFHGTESGRRGWGEATLSNIIFTEDQEPVMCDFEVRYGDDVSDLEAQARDLKDMCMSVASALEAAHGEDVGTVVKALLDSYGDDNVIAEVKRLAEKKRGILQSIFFGYEKARTGVSGKEQYDAVRQAIVSY